MLALTGQSVNLNRLIRVLIKHAEIHGINVTIELLKIIGIKELVSYYELNKKIKRIEKLTTVSKYKLWEKSKGAEDRLAFCKAVMVLIYEYGK